MPEHSNYHLALLKIVVLGLACSFAAQATAQVVVGPAKAVDGDTLEISGKRVRLFGIDAPELDQTCQKDGASWPCGQIATEQLASLVSGSQVECRGNGVDQYGRVLGICSVGTAQLNAVMVEYGWALAYRQYSDDYVPAEGRAKANRVGLWSSTFALPSDYRQSKMEPIPAVPPPVRQLRKAQPPLWTGGCLIKGNRNRRGEWIYHLPGMPYYNQTRAEEMFCTEAQALAAGYRRAKVQ